jgi:flagellar hook-associated protein 1 FlgK
VEINGDNLNGGKLKGYFDLRDGNTSDNIGLPYLMQKLDVLTQGIVSAYNEVHQKGYTIPTTNDGESKTGVNFFDDQGGDITKVNALNMDISQDIKDSVWNIAASGLKVDLSAANTQEGNNQNALEIETVSTLTTLPNINNINNYLAGIVSELGVRAEQCNNMNDSQELIVDNVDDLRMSISAVSLDEEVTNLITYQRAYQASSRVLTTIDEMLDKLINGTGKVGL